MNTDRLTTVLGVLLGALIAANVDLSKLFARDKGEMAKAAGALLIAAHGWATNKASKSDPDPESNGSTIPEK